MFLETITLSVILHYIMGLKQGPQNTHSLSLTGSLSISLQLDRGNKALIMRPHNNVYFHMIARLKQ